MIAHATRGTRFAALAASAKGEFMANERDRNMGTNTDSESVGGEGGRRGESTGEQVGGISDENIRGTADDMEEDEFEEADDLDDEEDEEEGGGTI
jgi:hypothetical protein